MSQITSEVNQDDQMSEKLVNSMRLAYELIEKNLKAYQNMCDELEKSLNRRNSTRQQEAEIRRHNDMLDDMKNNKTLRINETFSKYFQHSLVYITPWIFLFSMASTEQLSVRNLFVIGISYSFCVKMAYELLSKRKRQLNPNQIDRKKQEMHENLNEPRKSIENCFNDLYALEVFSKRDREMRFPLTIETLIDVRRCVENRILIEKEIEKWSKFSKILEELKNSTIF